MPRQAKFDCIVEAVEAETLGHILVGLITPHREQLFVRFCNQANG
jgi:hypothetical protein